jgi:hypothetical protein
MRTRFTTSAAIAIVAPDLRLRDVVRPPREGAPLVVHAACLGSTL